jgi:hypothetical protein
MRERFWISENRRYEVLQQLKSAEGIEEVVVLSTGCSPGVAETGACRHQIGERT